MPQPARLPSEHKSLTEKATSLVTLLDHIHTTTTVPSLDESPQIPDSKSIPSTENSTNPFTLLADTAKLIKAHTTKLTLLSINTPFTPSALITVLSSLTICVPVLPHALTLIAPSIHTLCLTREFILRVRRVINELRTVVSAVRDLGPDGGQDAKSRGSLISAGVVWETCDNLVSLADGGLAGFVLSRARAQRALLEDALVELREWRDNGEDEDEGFEEGEDGIANDEDMFGTRLPSDRVELKAKLEKCLKKCRLVSTLFAAMIKRRFEKMPSTVAPSVIDGAVRLLGRIPEGMDVLAGAFYDLDEDGVEEAMTAISDDSRLMVTLARLSWIDGKEDEFTTWSDKWLEAIDKDSTKG